MSLLCLHELLDRSAAAAPDAAFAEFGGAALSYGDAVVATRRLANAFASAGLNKGDRVAFLMKNCADLCVLYYAAARAGVVPVPLNYRLAPPEWEYIVADAGAKALIARGELATAAAEGCALESVHTRLGIGVQPAGWEDFGDFAASGDDRDPGVAVDIEDDVYQMYTSGTTGRPKGAVLRHRNVAANIEMFPKEIRLDPGDRYLITAPLYHAAAALATFWVTRVGACSVVHEDFDPVAVVRALSEERIQAATLVPAMIQACLVMAPDVAERRYDDLRFIVYGASPIAEATLRRALEVFGCDFAQGYGMTETTAALTFLLPEHHRRALAGEPHLLLSAGRPLPGTEVRIVDDDDRDVSLGSIGEIVARGPQIMRGYWNLPEATEKALRGGWMHTGDAGVMDAEGFVTIQDRVKDMIVSGAENVYPREIEDVLFEHPAVADVAVIGIPHPQWGEAVKAVVVLRDGADASEDALVEFCRGRLAGYKRPRSIDFVPALPRNPSGKVLKRELREPYWQGHARRVS